MIATRIDTDHRERPAPADCRLCGASLTWRFNLQVLGKYDVRYYKCEGCGSLQTERPFWLEEAYEHNLSNLDTGAAQRNLSNLAACYVACRLFGLRNVIDAGGGDGLLCRLLRDYGINCFVRDKYARPTYAQGFSEPDFERPDLVTAFEVLEHLAVPRIELDDLFHLQPQVLLVSTELFVDQQADWPYLAAASGQHVFFYSRRALSVIAARYDYRLLQVGGFILFIRQERLTRTRALLANLLFRGKVCRLVTALLVLRPAPPGVWADHERQKSRALRHR